MYKGLDGEKISLMSTQIATLQSAQVSEYVNDDQAWQQLVARDPGAPFFYAVLTTGVFCRPGCASRLPLRENVRFFPTTAEARAAGFRPCQRCKPDQARSADPVARMCAYLESHIDEPVRLATLGKLVKMSPFTAQRRFKQTMCVTPAQYQRAMRATALRDQLRGQSQAGESDVTTAIYEAGYGSSSRAYEKTPLGMTPGRFLSGGLGETIRFAIAEAPKVGWVIVGSTERGLCWVALGGSAEALDAEIRAEFPAATLKADPNLAGTVAAVIQKVQGLDGRTDCSERQSSLPLDLRGTAFQLRVWAALQQIPAGETRSYSQLACELGNPKATRAVARACATNRVALLVPCHRVVGASGALTGYRWGVERKRELLSAERR